MPLGSRSLRVVSALAILLLSSQAAVAHDSAKLRGSADVNAQGEATLAEQHQRSLLVLNAADRCTSVVDSPWTYNTLCYVLNPRCLQRYFSAAVPVPDVRVRAVSDPCHWQSGNNKYPPDQWGNLAGVKCKNTAESRQSPINIITAEVVLASPVCANTISIVKPGACLFSDLTAISSGHAFEMAYIESDLCSQKADFPTISYMGHNYHLKQIHFHSVSEHTINGENADVETHLVHIDEETGKIIVIAVMLKGALIAAPAEVEKYFALLGRSVGGIYWDSTFPKGFESQLANPYLLLPKDMSYYTYEGSLTTPGCSEIVTWIVMAKPVSIQVINKTLFQFMQASALAPITTLVGTNNRPTQPLNGRKVSKC
ncbi:alpha carbonic anhydrase [Tribonema minus]|uniref:carbonic anhydrase n=1 Tax=Tribonema minus TaxID=303371 RepID=A0A835YKL9_9STRA|nr:alpha carbonic anhydrase [Tribonema minus]